MSADANTETVKQSFWERYRQLFNRRGEDGWSILFGYPVARFFVLLILPIRAITPTTITLVGFVVKIAAAVMILPQYAQNPWLVFALLQVAQVLDSMDGTLARARPAFSKLGAFLDKITDAAGLFAICAAVGLRASFETGTWYLAPLGALAGFCFLQLCYMFWIVKASVPPKEVIQNSDGKMSGKDLAGGAEVLPWSDLFREWLHGFVRLYQFSEADLYLWIALFAVLEEWKVCVYLLVATQGIVLIKRTVDHVRTMLREDKLAAETKE